MSNDGPLDPRLNLLRPDPAGNIECAICGRAVEITKAYRCQEGTLPDLHVHGSCANGKTPRELQRMYHRTMRRLFPVPSISPFEPLRLN